MNKINIKGQGRYLIRIYLATRAITRVRYELPKQWIFLSPSFQWVVLYDAKIVVVESTQIRYLSVKSPVAFRVPGKGMLLSGLDPNCQKTSTGISFMHISCQFEPDAVHERLSLCRADTEDSYVCRGLWDFSLLFDCSLMRISTISAQSLATSTLVAGASSGLRYFAQFLSHSTGAGSSCCGVGIQKEAKMKSYLHVADPL